MNIVVLTASSPQKSSGIIAIDLMNGFLNNGHYCVIITNYYVKTNNRNIIPIKNYFQGILAKLYRFIYKKKNKILNKFNNLYYIQDINQTKSNSFLKKILKILPFKPDAFIYLFPQYFLNARDLYLLNKQTNAPVLWYMMDMLSITGGCHYAWDCKGYTKSCGKCPALLSNDPFDQTFRNLDFKKKYVDKANIIPIAASEWQLRQLKESSLFQNKKKFKILSPTDDIKFIKNDKKNARKKLNLPLEKKIIFFGAVNPHEKRKGFIQLIETINILFNEISIELRNNILILIAGVLNTELKNMIPFETNHLGYLNHDNLAVAYQAADLYLNASIEDSGPTMINQSIMSGTPVVAFEMGVAPDLIKAGLTGYIAKLRDTHDLAKGVNSILSLSDNEYENISNNCRDLAVSNFSLKIVCEEFQNLIMANRENE
ncbi:glycosyltransferase [Candidatus Neomarinimicrobiota bacterium]